MTLTSLSWNTFLYATSGAWGTSCIASYSPAFAPVFRFNSSFTHWSDIPYSEVALIPCIG